MTMLDVDADASGSVDGRVWLRVLAGLSGLFWGFFFYGLIDLLALAQGAQFHAALVLSTEVPKIQASPAFGADGLIVVVWDEGSDADPRHVGAALLGPQVKPSRSAAKLDHYSLLRTLEDGFGIHRHLAHAAHAHAFNGIWR